MEHKVLIADDSLTIQKVIKITLANEPFELHDCPDAGKLVDMVKDIEPAMVLLDFNLSEDKTGYDLCREIKSVNQNIGVLMLFGTFDTIDEALLSDCGCNYHIVKPFDGAKFINLCRTLASDFEGAAGAEGHVSSIEPTRTQVIPQEILGEESEDEDEWVVNQPKYEEEEESDTYSNGSIDRNKLEMEVEDWGMEVPAVIGKSEEDSSMEIPGVIEEEAEEMAFTTSEEEEETVLPKSDDLEYPELGVMTDENDHIQAGTSPLDDEMEYPESVESAEPKSKLVPLNELKGEEEAIEEYDEELSYSAGGTDTEEGVRNLEEQIRDEIEEGQDLWAVDVVENEDFKPLEPEAFEEEDTQILHMDDLVEDQVEEEAEEVEEPKETLEHAISEAVDLSALKEKIEIQVRKELEGQLSPLVERFVKDYCKEQIEKVAWEVIPDLAENIIKKEIQKISDSIID